MTVDELMMELKEMPQDAEVYYAIDSMHLLPVRSVAREYNGSNEWVILDDYAEGYPRQFHRRSTHT
jgi:hypothetical protein